MESLKKVLFRGCTSEIAVKAKLPGIYCFVFKKEKKVIAAGMYILAHILGATGIAVARLMYIVQD